MSDPGARLDAVAREPEWGRSRPDCFPLSLSRRQKAPPVTAPTAVARLCVTYWGAERRVYEANDALEEYRPTAWLSRDAEKGERSRGAAFTHPFSHQFRFIATFSGETCSRCFNDDGLGNAVGVPSTEVRARGRECWLKMCHGGGGPAVLTAPPRCRIGLSGAAPPCRNSPRRPETRTDCFSCSAPYRRRHRRRAGTALHYDLATRGFRRVLDDGVGPNGLSARSRRVVPTTATPRRSIWRDGWSC